MCFVIFLGVYVMFVYFHDVCLCLCSCMFLLL